MTQGIGPSYQLVADDIRSKISSGEYTVGNPIPSTTQLMEMHHVSSTVVRHAVDRLKSEGVLIGHGGKAVFVRATPDEAVRGRQDTEALGREMSQFRDEFHQLANRLESLESGDIRAALVRLELNLIDLYGKLGFDYPRDDEAGEDGNIGSKAAGHGNLA